MKVAGTAGLSVGVYKKGEPAYFANFGYRNVEKRLPVSDTTIFPACSLTKLFISMAMALEIDNPASVLEWDTPVKDILPDFNIRDDAIRNKSTITDILAHRTGMSQAGYYYGNNNRMLIAHEDSQKFINDQHAVHHFRTQYLYCNLGYELAGLVLNKQTGSWARVLREELLSSLDMTRSTIGQPSTTTANVSRAYNTLDDGTPVAVPTVQAGESTFLGASAGLFTCTKDLLKAYSAVSDAILSEFDVGQTRVFSDNRDSPIKQAEDLFTPKMYVNEETSYAFGLCRVQLPASMGHVGLNPGLLGDVNMPLVARGVSPTLVFYHQGSLPGALSSMAIIPSLDISIVVMSNTLSLNDCPDWVLQLLIEEILDAPYRNDYIEFAKRSRNATIWRHNEIGAYLERKRVKGTYPKPLDAYVGTYWNAQRYLKIKVTLSNGKLAWALQGLDSEEFELVHYENDTFLWYKNRDYLVSRGRWVDQPPIYWKLRFCSNAAGEIASVKWTNDPGVLDGEEFFKS